MLDRHLKIMCTAMLGVMALLYLLHNLVNLAQAHGAFLYVLGLKDHSAYPVNLLPALGPGGAWLVAAVTFVLEGFAAIALLWGAWAMLRSRNAEPAMFDRASDAAKLGAGAALLVWFGMFAVFGGAGYQMWQTELGSGSLGDAFTFWSFAFLLLLYLNQPDRARK